MLSIKRKSILSLSIAIVLLSCGGLIAAGIELCVGYEQITDLSSAVGLSNIPTGTNAPTYAIIKPETNGVRWRGDGTDPTANVGHPLASGESLTYNADLNTIKFIQTGAGAKLNVTYFK